MVPMTTVVSTLMLVFQDIVYALRNVLFNYLHSDNNGPTIEHCCRADNFKHPFDLHHPDFGKTSSVLFNVSVRN